MDALADKETIHFLGVRVAQQWRFKEPIPVKLGSRDSFTLTWGTAHPQDLVTLLFEVITRRYQQRATVLTTNKTFGEWNQVFPNAACVVTLVDRLVHRSEILAIDGDSYRLKEAQEQAAAKTALRANRKQKQSR